MDLRRTLFRALQTYFWILVVLSVLTLVWVANRVLLDETLVACGWFAVAGFGLLIAVFLVVIRRTAS